MIDPRKFVLGSLLLTTGFVSTGWSALPGTPTTIDQYDDIAFNGKVIAQVAKDLPPGKIGATLVCLNGHQFALGAMLGLGSSTPAVSVVQVYEAHNGGTRPATCKSR